MIKTLLSSFDNILEFDFDLFHTFYNLKNGKTVNILTQFLSYKNLILENNKFYEKINVIREYSKVTIGINLSTDCNLGCTYCFSKEKGNKKLSLLQIEDFIKFIVNINDNAKVFYVDLAGSGEPLLYLKDIVEIAKLCKSISDVVEKQITVMLSTNGILLTKQVTNILQKNNILFGISLDGYKELHDLNRIDKFGKPTFDRILSNVNNIEFNEYVGGAMTITSSETDIYKAYIEMMQLFKTVSIRPCRMSYKNFSFSKIEKGYEKLSEFLLAESRAHDFSNIKKIINGDDYFGKYIIKIISNSVMDRRCGVGVSRFSIGIDGKYYPCSPAIMHKELELSSADIISGTNNSYFCNVNDNCSFCIAKNICGSECFVLVFESSEQKNLCEFWRNLLIIALKLCGQIEMENYSYYAELVNIVNEIIMRSCRDEELHKTYLRHKNKYTFTETKNIKDHEQSLYKKLFSNNDEK